MNGRPLLVRDLASLKHCTLAKGEVLWSVVPKHHHVMSWQYLNAVLPLLSPIAAQTNRDMAPVKMTARRRALLALGLLLQLSLASAFCVFNEADQ